jgi:hypothetical protein
LYKVEIDPEAHDQIGTMPTAGLIALAEVLAFLELTPWAGKPHHTSNPDGALRRVLGGSRGRVTYLILEDRRRVDVPHVLWLG